MQTLPPTAEAYALDQRREIAAAVAAVRRLWRRMGDDFDGSWAHIGPQMLAVTDIAQERVAVGALEYVPAVLEDTGQVQAVRAVATPQPRSLVGVAGDGRPVSGLLYEAVVGAKTAIRDGASAAQALAQRGQWLTMATGTLLSDTGRQAESLGMGVRPVSGYVRMLTPPSCSRCVVLAGRWYRKSAGFARHPGCDCRHIPSSESVGGEMTVDPRAHFDSLDVAGQDATFGKAGADAIREGADIGQVVNARRGVSLAGQTSTTSREMWVRKPDGSVVWESRTVNVTRRQAQATQVGGRNVLTTTEGTTRRGQASRAATGRRGARLMPETISQVATDREDYLRLLRVNGYI